jgi:hypothetical protein
MSVDPTDPRPTPPLEPLPEECCGGGCDPCVYDRYYDALERYREALRLWQLRQPADADTKSGRHEDN